MTQNVFIDVTTEFRGPPAIALEEPRDQAFTNPGNYGGYDPRIVQVVIQIGDPAQTTVNLSFTPKEAQALAMQLRKAAVAPADKRRECQQILDDTLTQLNNEARIKILQKTPCQQGANL